MLNYTQKFSSDSDDILFAHSVIQKLNLRNQMNIAMKKVTLSQLRADMLNSEKVKKFIVSN